MTDAISASYKVNEFIQQQLTIANLTTPIFPGRFAPENAPDIFATYLVKQSTGFEYYMVHTDNMSYKFYNTHYDSLQKTVSLLLDLFNVENFGRDSGLSESGISFKTTYCNITNTDEDIYIEGNNYFEASLDISLVYTVIS